MNSSEVARACLAELRDELRRSAPTVRRGRLRAIRDAHGLPDYPAGFLLDTSTASAARRAARVMFGARGRPGSGAGHPLFHPAFYRLSNPDVAAGRVDAWLHYQLHGRNEGRSPHPFIDASRLASLLPNVLPGERLDIYLVEPAHWGTSLSPYVDVEGFMHRGPWDGLTPPLHQILRDHPGDPWLRLRLGLIDLGTAPDAVGVAVGVLAARRPALASLTSVSIWVGGHGQPATAIGPAGAYRVVPGLFVGGPDGATIAFLGRETVSADGTAARTAEGVVTLDVRNERSAERFVALAADVPNARLRELASALGPRDIVAPATAAQERALRDLGAPVLPFNHQVTVAAARFELEGGVA